MAMPAESFVSHASFNSLSLKGTVNHGFPGKATMGSWTLFIPSSQGNPPGMTALLLAPGGIFTLDLDAALV